jgi:hypothetical protein
METKVMETVLKVRSYCVSRLLRLNMVPSKIDQFRPVQAAAGPGWRGEETYADC